MKGDGSLYRRGKGWWVTYSIRGQRVRESLGTEDGDIARRKYRALRMKLLRGELLTNAERSVTVGKLLDDLEAHLAVKGIASLSKIRSHLKAVRRALGSTPAAELDTSAIERYQADRLAAGRARATVNLELQGLRQAYGLAARRTPPLVLRVPHIPLFKVENARQGFLSRAEFEALLPALRDVDVRDFVEWIWWTGMRPGEVRQLTWGMLDRESWTLLLDPRAAKTRTGRAIALTGPVLAIIKRRLERRLLECPLIFHRTSKGRLGQPVRDFRLQWQAALAAAGLAPGLLPYDLRRTAIRNMVRAGVDPSTAMKVSGHRTRSTFDRYNIVSEDDIRGALAQTAAYVEALPTKRNVERFPAARKKASSS